MPLSTKRQPNLIILFRVPLQKTLWQVKFWIMLICYQKFLSSNHFVKVNRRLNHLPGRWTNQLNQGQFTWVTPRKDRQMMTHKQKMSVCNADLSWPWSTDKTQKIRIIPLRALKHLKAQRSKIRKTDKSPTIVVLWTLIKCQCYTIK